jgi:hypothetical protein
MTDYELQCAHARAWHCTMPEQRMFRAELRRRGVAERVL